MNNKAHLRPKDFDSNGDIIPTSWKNDRCNECFKRAKNTGTLLFCEATGKCKRFEKGGAEE